MMRRHALAGTLALLNACAGGRPTPEPAAPVRAPAAGVSIGSSSAPVPAPLPAAAPAAPAPSLARSAVARSWARLDSSSARIPVFVVTTRRSIASERPGERFTAYDGDSLQFATALVNVPSYAVRAQGEIPTPPSTRVNRFWFRPDSGKDMFVAQLVPHDSSAFVHRVGDDLAGTRSRALLVFIHGYNVGHEDAVLRAAQVAADVGFDGTIVTFDWPSAGSLGGYVRDQQAARNAGFHLAQFFRWISVVVAPDQLHAIAHSMGSEVLSRAAIALPPDSAAWRFDQVIFAAPDIDARLFRREVLPRLTSRARRVTLYASGDDEALRASRSVNGIWRLGLGGDSLVVLPNMDTIDATRVRADMLGHTLFVNAGFLSDLALLLAEGKPPAARRLLPVTRDSLVFWRFRAGAR